MRPEYKVTLLGAGGVGKSAITLRIVSGTFTPTYNPTIEDYYRHEADLPSIGPCVVEILDTAGTEQFASMRQLYITNSQAFAIIYSIDSLESFEEAKQIYADIIEIKPANELAIVLVGNKCDMSNDKREISIAEGAQAAKNMSNCRFIETSAKDNINVNQLFEKLVYLARDNVQSSTRTKHPSNGKGPNKKAVKKNTGKTDGSRKSGCTIL